MSLGERQRRSDPVRTAPIRTFSTTLRRPESPEGAEPGGATKPPGGRARDGSWSDVVAEGVDLAYRVIEEEIRLGQQAAEQLNRRSYAMGSDMVEAGERLVRYSADLWISWLEFAGSLARNADSLRNLSRPPEPESVRSADATAGATAVSIAITSPQPARVTLHLHPTAEGCSLAVRDLKAGDPGKPALTDVLFTPGAGGIMDLQIRVPQEQPPDLYAGLVVDQRTGQPVGTLSVQVGE